MIKKSLTQCGRLLQQITCLKQKIYIIYCHLKLVLILHLHWCLFRCFYIYSTFAFQGIIHACRSHAFNLNIPSSLVSYESFSLNPKNFHTGELTFLAPFLACPFLRLHPLAPVLSHQIQKPALWLISRGLLLTQELRQTFSVSLPPPLALQSRGWLSSWPTPQLD